MVKTGLGVVAVGSLVWVPVAVEVGVVTLAGMPDPVTRTARKRNCDGLRIWSRVLASG